MTQIKYKEIVKNKRLTDFSGVKEMVIANKVKNVPSALKADKREFDKHLDFFD
ncbi:MAG: hypothetical protein ACQEP1_05035 [Nanobdellota archaeon]